MPELERITVEGFRSIRSIVDLPLGDINILIGANGAGKSNFIGVFEFLRSIRRGELQSYVGKNGGAERILHFGSRTTEKIRIHVFFKDDINQYEIELEPTISEDLLPSREVVYFWGDKKTSEPFQDTLMRKGREAGISDENVTGVALFVRQHLDRWRIYHFHDTGPKSPMKKTPDINDNRFLRSDGSNLAAFLYFLRKKHSGEYGQIVKAIKRIAPFFRDFDLAPDRLNEKKIRLVWRHTDSEGYFDVSSLSDGSLRFMALATLLLQPNELRSSVILMDEPELGLHPLAITMLASLIKQASHKSQLIISTQSSLLLDHFEPKDIMVAELKDGGTLIKRLDTERLSEWLEDYSLGQLWEKNEIGGRPS
ncbi:MAG: AAA family ATPase [Chloroflexi bacterium]|nr:AAA family ATPase [Chloroflexota bacterium]